MLVGGDLGFLCLVLVVLVVLVLPIIGVVLRRKWWFAAARREEIKRLLILASDESAGADHEVTTGYGFGAEASVSQQLQYQCAVCFFPTTTRCAQCKAVRYCSGKCQIIHWRQGHKEECRPFTIFDQSNDRGGGDTHCASSSSSGWSVDSSNDSLSETSTPSSGFWDGPIESSSSKSGGDIVAPMTQQGSNTKTIISDDGPTIQGIKKHIDEAALSEELCKDDLKSKNSPILSLQKSKSIHVDTCSNSHALKSREIKSSTSSAYCVRPSVGGEGHSITKDAKVASSSPSLSSERSNYVATDATSSSYALRYQEVGSLLYKDSDESLTSCSGRDSGQTASSKVGNGIHGVTTCSSQFPSYSENARNGLKTSTLKVVDQLKASKLSRHYQSAAGNETVGRCMVKDLFPYELFVKLYNWDKFELHPCGLINCGNSCYANVVLQCLAFTPPLTAYLLQGLHSKACAKKQWCFTCEFESIILKAKEGNSPLSPIRILSHIENISTHLSHGREEDAHEFLRYAIDAMQSICLKEAGTKTSGYLDEETTLMGLTFGGYLQSKIKCMKCGGKSERHERMMDLAVEIDGNICTLEEALRQFTGTEILDGENKYECSRCKSFEKAKKKLTIMEAPNILTVALKRFQSGKFGKLSKSIQFPESLDIAPYMSTTSDKSSIYRLYGVVVHLDIMNASFSGHYVCYVKNIQDKWFKIDDSKVNAVKLDRALTKGAYMLFYARCSPRPPKLRNSLVPRDPRKPKNPSLRSRSYSTGPRDTNRTDCLTYQTTMEVFYPNHLSFQQTCPISEEDSSSDNSSSFFSEVGSCSTESSSRDSTSTDDYFDQIFGDLGHNLKSPWRNSSDSDTSFSSTSPYPLYSKHSPPANSVSYTSTYRETSSFLVDHAESARDGAWARQPSRSSTDKSLEGKGSVSFLCCDMTKQYGKLDSSIHHRSSCRETNSDRLGRLNPFNSLNEIHHLSQKIKRDNRLNFGYKGF